MKRGSIVLPQGGKERVMGIVLGHPRDDDQLMMVMWISATRGVFVAEEVDQDLTLCSLNGRAEVTDYKIDHSWLAVVLSLVMTAGEDKA